MNEFNELEYKYKSDNIDLSEFIKLMEGLKPSKRLDISSWDYYYVKSENEFIRFRESNTPELTKKVKTKDTNNWKRIEVDLPLDPKRITEETVAKFVSLDGYYENFRIYKSCFIFWLNEVNYVYYIVFDQNMKELGRFIEVEVNKNTSLGLQELDLYAEKLKCLGLSPQNRLKKSLFEMFKK